MKCDLPVEYPVDRLMRRAIHRPTRRRPHQRHTGVDEESCTRGSSEGCVAPRTANSNWSVVSLSRRSKGTSLLSDTLPRSAFPSSRISTPWTAALSSVEPTRMNSDSSAVKSWSASQRKAVVPTGRGGSGTSDGHESHAPAVARAPTRASRRLPRGPRDMVSTVWVGGRGRDRVEWTGRLRSPTLAFSAPACEECLPVEPNGGRMAQRHQLIFVVLLRLPFPGSANSVRNLGGFHKAPSLRLVRGSARMPI